MRRHELREFEGRRTLMRSIFIAATVALLITSPGIQGSLASDGPADTAIHNDLRSLRDSMLTAINTQNIDALAKHVHRNIVLTVENGNRFRGVDQIRAFYESVFSEDDGFLRSFEVQDLSVDELAILYGGDTAIGFGAATSKYVPIAGPELVISSKWTATLALEEGKWLVTSFQNTVDFTDNPLMDAIYEEVGLKIVLPVGVVCLLIGGLVGKRLRKSQSH